MDYSNFYFAIGIIGLVLSVLLWWAKSRYVRMLFLISAFWATSWKLPSLNLPPLDTLVIGIFVLLIVSFVTAIVDQAGGMKSIPRLFFPERIKDHVATTALAAILVLPPLYFLS